MPTIKLLNENVLIESEGSQLMLTENQAGGVDAMVGAATVGASSTTDRVAGSPVPNVSNEWIENALQDAGCSDEEIKKVLDHLGLDE